MEIRQIPYSRALNERALLEAYAEECSIPEIGRPQPQRDLYAGMEYSGYATCFGVFEGDKLVGFASLLTTMLPHYGKRVATVESIYVLPEYHAGLDLLRTLEKHAFNVGCVAILYSAPAGGRFEKLLASMKDCRQTNTVFCRAL